jgi:hypothetical protein
MSNVHEKFGSIGPNRFVFEKMEVGTDKTTTCDVCSNPGVKYVHVLREIATGEEYRVGCVCPGAMLGDQVAARKRQKEAAAQSGKEDTPAHRGKKDAAGEKEASRLCEKTVSFTFNIQSVHLHF